MHAVNRRRFLTTTAAGGLAIAAGTRAAPAFMRQLPSETVRVAVMGTNGRGLALANGFAANAHCQVVCVCDVDENARNKAVDALGKVQKTAPRAEVDIRRVLDDPTVDALVVATPDHWHGPATIMACAAGKHVYVEKPACHNGQEGQWMIAAAHKYNRSVQVGTQRRSSAGHKAAVDRLREGCVGAVHFARGWITSTRPSIGYGKPADVPAHLNYDLWQGPAPEMPFMSNLIHYNWHWFWNWGTGELGNNGVHALDVCRWGLGVEYPNRVTSTGAKYFFDDDQQTPDTQIAVYEYDDVAIQWEHRTWNKRGLEGSSFGCVFMGESGSMVLTEGSAVVYDMDGKELEKLAIPYDDATHIQDFVDGIKTHKRLNADIEEGVKSTTLCLLGNISCRVGRSLTFDGATASILDDPEAAKLWTREYRSGWEPKV